MSLYRRGVFHLWMALWILPAASAHPHSPVDHQRPGSDEFPNDTIHPLAFDMPTSPEDTDFVPAEMIAGMSGPQESPREEEEEVTSEEQVEDEHSKIEELAGSVVPSEEEGVAVSEDRRRRSTCQGPHKHHINLHVYTIMSKDADKGVSNKNAADSLGDFAFIFGSRGYPSPRGVKDYYDDGVIVVNHMSVSSWGDYLQCNHAKGSTTYTCKCPSHYKGSCDMKRAGQESNSHTNGHVWYSFPLAGKGTYWDYNSGSHCGTNIVTAKCVIDALASHAGCKGKCSADNAHECVMCVHKLSDKQQKAVWDAAIWDGGCHDSNRRRRSKFTANASAVMGGGMASMDVIV